MWDVDDDEWFNDAPIVLCTETQQLEFCANRLSDFSLSTDSIDLSLPVYWCGEEESDFRPLRWVQQRNNEFHGFVQQSIAGVEVIEARVQSEMQKFLGLKSWILSGIAL
ncbi:MAG: hypothetical protein AAFR42_16475, partial [Cyanobacteria bacterium J06628_6]